MTAASTALAGPSLTLEWGPSPDADVNNYRLYWGPSSGNYTGFSDLGNVTNTVFTQLVPGGHYYFVVTAMNAEGAESDPSNEIDFLIPSGNTPPTISPIASQTVVLGTSIAPLNVTVGDPETPADSLILTAGSSNPSLIPVANITFGGSGGSRSVAVIPVSGQTGASTISVTVSDGQGGTASVSFVITVNPAANTAPTITAVANQSIAEDTATASLSFTVGDSQTAAASLNVTASSSSPTLIPTANIALGGSGAYRTVGITPATNQSGSATMTLTVSDAEGLSSSTGFTITVNAVNDAPTVSGIANVTTSAGTATAAQPFTVGDVETAAGSLTLSATSSNPSLIPAANIAFGGSGANRTVAATPISGQSGTSTLTVTVGDGQGGSASSSFVVTVNAPANTAPTISVIANVSTSAGTATAAQPFTVGDVETAAGSLTLSATSSNPSLIPVANIAFGGSSANRTVTATPVSGQSGTSTLTVTVSDGQGGAANSSFVVMVNAPTNTVSTMVNLVWDPSPEADVIGYRLYWGPASGNYTNHTDVGNVTNAVVTQLVPGGHYYFAVTAISADGAESVPSNEIEFHVLDGNNPPIISAIARQTVVMGTPIGPLAFTVSDAETPAGSLTLAASSSNPSLVPVANITFGGNGTNRSVTLVPVSGQTGASTISVTVTDGQGGNSSASFEVTVNPVANSVPTITAVANQSIGEDTATTTLAFTVGDAQTAAGSLTVTATSSTPTLIPTANITLGGSSANRTVRVTPATNLNGVATISLTVTDAEGLSASTSFTVTVNAVNDAPTISAIADVTTPADTATAARPFTMSDIETAAGNLSLSATSSNPSLIPVANIAFGGNGANRTVAATPVSGQSGTSTLTVTVSDGQGGSASDSFVVTVNAPTNSVPTITTIANQTIAEDTATTTLSFTVGDAQTAAGSLNVGAASSNPSLIPLANIVLGGSGANRTVRVTPATNQNGVATITLTVSDAGGLTANSSFTVTVGSVNDAPTISSIANVSTSAGAATMAQPFTVGDVETVAGSLTLSAASSNPSLIPVANIAFGGSGSNRTVAATPVSGQSGTSTLTVTVSDGQGASASSSFVVTVNPPTSATNNFLAYWNFDEPSGSIAYESINHRDGTLSGVTRTNGVSGGALLFDGINAVLNVNSAADLAPGTNLSISLWFKPSMLLDSTTGRRDLVKKPYSFWLMFNSPSADGRLTFALSSGLPKVQSITASWQPNRWHHVAATYDGAAMRLYVNGVLEGTAPASIPAATNNHRIQIGGNTDQNDSYCFGGAIDEIRFFPQPLATAEVVALYNSYQNAGNADPTISTVSDQSIALGATPSAVAFVVGDNETPAASLIVSGESSNPTLVPNAGVVLGGSGANRTVTVLPAAGQVGETTITLSVSDGERTTRRSFRCAVTNSAPNVLALATVGEGVVTPNLAGKALVVGKSYTLTAKPAAGYLFAGWEGASNCTRTALTLVLRTNTHLVAKFVRNPFLPVVGQFTGLFHEADEVRHDTSGHFRLTLGSTGTYSARIINGIRVHAWTGRFALDGLATNIIRRSTNLGNLTVVISLDAASNLITGTVTAPTWRAALTADRAGYWTATNPSPYAARYTALLPAGGDGARIPAGVGYSLGTVSTNGLLVLSTALPDGRVVTVSPRVSKNGHFPLYAWVLGGRGSVLGWVNFENQTSGEFSGLLSWSRPFITGARYYPAGFTNDLPISGSRYVAPKSTNAIMNFNTGLFALVGGNLAADIYNDILLQPPAKVVNLSSNAIKVTFTTATGKFTGTAKDPASGRTITFNGVALQNGGDASAHAAGHFMGTNQFGGVYLVH